MSESSVDPSSFRPFEVSPVHLVYVGLGFFIVLFGMFSLFIKERLYLGEAPLAAVFGIIVGPACLNLFNPSHWANNDTGAPGGQITDEISLEVLRVTIALSVFAVGVELPKKYLLRHWRSIAFLLGPVMVWGWLITAAFMYALIPGLDFLNSLVVASCVTPTDPILAQAVVGGPWAEKHVPAHLRHILMCESGCNDGAAFPFLYLALFLSTNRDNHGKAIAEWFYDAWAYQIIFGTLLGALIGWAARKLMRFSERHKLVDRESFVAQYVSLAIASMGVNVLLGSDDLLAAFACGTAFAWDGWFTRQTEDSNFSSIVDLLFNVAVFIYIGSLMPFQDWTGGSSDEPNTLSLWRLFVLAFCVLLTKRIPVVIALWRWIPDIKTFREAVFAGHFGPIGVGAIFIATLARTELPEHIPSPPQSSNDILALTVQPVIYFFVICSIALHGLTIPFFAFSKGASRLTRTWSRNPSFAAVDGEPNWVSRMRSKRTGESLRAEEGNMTEIERVLNAQLRQIGKGAIGGDAEKDMSRSATQNGSGGSRTSDSEDPSHHLNEGAALRQRRRAQGDGDADGDAFDSPSPEDPQSGDWDGEDTIEMRRYLEKQKAKKEDEYAALRRKQQDLDEAERESRDSEQRDHHEGDLGAQKMLDEERGPMDRDIPRTRSEEEAHQDKSAKAELKEDAEHGDAQSKGFLGLHLTSSASSTSSSQQEREHAKVRAELEEPFPRMRSWVEGDQLVIEYQKHRFSDVECHTLPLFDHERDSISSSDDPAHTWAIQHAEALEHYGGFSGVRNWSTSEAMQYLVDHGIPKRYTDAMLGRKKRRPSVSESKEDRDSRFNALYGGIAYASQRRDKENDDGVGGSSRNEATHEHEHESERQSRPRSRKTSKAPKGERQRTPSPEVIGWLAARPVKPGKVTGPAGSSRRTSQQRLDKHGASSPTRSNSPPMRTGSSIRFAPREHKLACDSRRRSTRKKVLAGRVSLGPLASLAAGAAHVKEEVIETQSKEKEKESARRTGINVERSTSTGGLASEAEPSTSSSPAGHIRSFLGRQSDALFGNLPKTSSVGSIGGGSVRKPIHTNTQSSTSTTANWVDVNDRSHDNSRSLHSRRSESPSRMSTMELEKARSSHANDNRMHGYMPRSETIDSRHSNSEPRASDTSQHSSTHRKIGRLSTMLSTVTAHAAHVPRHLPGMRQEHTDRQPQSGSLRSASSTTQSLTPTAPAPIIHTYSANETGSGGGILADSSSSIAPSERQSVHSGTMSRHSTMPEQHEDPSGHHHTAERGVTFDV